MSPLFVLGVIVAIGLGASTVRFWPLALALLMGLAVAITLLGTILALAVDPLAEGGSIDWSRAPRAIAVNFCVALIFYGLGAGARRLTGRFGRRPNT